jgi:hypothetical protein
MEGMVSEANIKPQSPGSNINHVYLIEPREHVTVGTGCWCGPDLYRLCTACDDYAPCCWSCEGWGIVDVARTMTVCLDVRYRRWFRFAIGAWLMRIGARIAGCTVEVRSGEEEGMTR